MNLGLGGSDDRRGHRSGGHKGRSFDARGRSGSSRRRRNPLNDMELDQSARVLEGGEKRRRVHRSASGGGTGAPQRTVGLTHVLFLLVGLALGAALLLALSHLYSVISKARAEEKKAVPQATRPVPPAPEPPKPRAPQASDPVGAIRLMFQAASRGDRDTVYAQWDIRPEDVATVKRGQELSLEEVTDNGLRVAPNLDLTKLQYRVLSQSGSEARVEQSYAGVKSQVFLLRKSGGYWKLYSARAP